LKLVRSLGVEFRFGKDVTSEAALTQLEKDWDFIFLGIGLGRMRELEIPGGKHPGVVDALKFIEDYKTRGLLKIGRHVVVVGGGNTAIDAARAALRLGAESVRMMYRRSESNMSAFSFEYEQAKREGRGISLVDAAGRDCCDGESPKLDAIDCVRTELDSNGGLRPIAESRFGNSVRYGDSGDWTIATDGVFAALPGSASGWRTGRRGPRERDRLATRNILRVAIA